MAHSRLMPQPGPGEEGEPAEESREQEVHAGKERGRGRADQASKEEGRKGKEERRATVRVEGCTLRGTRPRVFVSHGFPSFSLPSRFVVMEDVTITASHKFVRDYEKRGGRDEKGGSKKRWRGRKAETDGNDWTDR